MSAMPDSTLADPKELIADLQRQLAECRAERDEALQREAATAEVLQVINSSPGDLAPVFDAILEKATTLCDARFGLLQLYDSGGFRFAAGRNLPATVVDYFRQRESAGNPIRPLPGGMFGPLVAGEPSVQIPDIGTWDRYRGGTAPMHRVFYELGGARTWLSVALREAGNFIGALSIYRREVRPFSDRHTALLQNFAAQAVIAMENARLINETREALEQQTATAEVLQVINASPGDLAPVFDAMLEKALRLCEGAFGGLTTYDGERFHTLATAGLSSELAEVFREPFIPAPESFHARIAGGEPLVHGDHTENPSLQSSPQTRGVVGLGGARTGLVIALRKDGRLVGSFWSFRQEVRPFSNKQIALLQNFAAQAVIAMENARLITETREARDAAEKALGELRAAQASLIQAEKMASLGQLTAGIAHEIKNPLNFVNNFAGLSIELLDELKQSAAPAIVTLDEDTRANVDETIEMLTSNLDKIAEHGKRADNIVKSMLEHSRGTSGERREVDLNALIDEALNLAYHGARAQDQSFNITLERDFEPGLAPIEVAPQEMTRVFLNLFSNSFYATTRRACDSDNGPFRPTLKVATRAAGDAIEIKVRDNGIGIPPEIRDKLFQPFFTTKPTGEGTGLGLSISYDIITQQHGGTITVESELGAYTVFTIHLPRRVAAGGAA